MEEGKNVAKTGKYVTQTCKNVAQNCKNVAKSEIVKERLYLRKFHGRGPRCKSHSDVESSFLHLQRQIS